METTALKHPPAIAVCATCPWRKKLQGQPHPAKWYTPANIRRLWNGIRSGRAPGVICHASDPNSGDYGSTRQVPATSETRPCAGVLQLVYEETAILAQAESFRTYQKSRRYPMSRAAIGQFLSSAIFGGGTLTPTIEPCDDVGFPWTQAVSQTDVRDHGKPATEITLESMPKIAKRKKGL